MLLKVIKQNLNNNLLFLITSFTIHLVHQILFGKHNLVYKINTETILRTSLDSCILH